MFRIFILSVIFCISASVSIADIKKPKTLHETLKIMKTYVAKHGTEYNPVIDRDDISLILTVDGRSLKMTPDNLHKKLREVDTASDRQSVLEHHMKNTLTYGIEFVFTKDDLQYLTPVFRHKDIADYADAYNDPLVKGKKMGDMVELYIVTRPERSASFLTESKLKAANYKATKIRKRARENLLKLKVKIKKLTGSSYTLIADGFHEASFLLDKKMWSTLHKKHGDLYVIVPNRDNVTFAPYSDKDIVGRLKNVKKKFREEYSYSLSEYAYIWNGKSWKVVE